MRIPRSTMPCLVLSAVGLLTACATDMTDPDPDPTPVVASAGGNGQSASVGQALANPIVVRVTEDGTPVSGTSVTWSVTSGGGSVSPTTSTTGANGQASTTWTLGPNAGANGAQAAVTGATGSPVSFSATGVGGAPPTTAAVTVRDNFFDPSSTTVAAGGTVTWTWAGGIDHNVTFASGTNSVDQTAGMFSRDFPTAGSFPYQCTIHGASMSGTVVVQ